MPTPGEHGGRKEGKGREGRGGEGYTFNNQLKVVLTARGWPLYLVSLARSKKGNIFK